MDVITRIQIAQVKRFCGVSRVANVVTPVMLVDP